jgi:SPP1 family predicted phage head-tail adaptor
MIDIGKYDRRVALKSRSTTQDANGQDVITWVAVSTVWAQRLPLRAAEVFADGQMQADVTHKYRIRHNPAWAPANTWRLEDTGSGGDTCDVVGVQPLGGRNEGWELLCRAGVKDGR